MMQPHRQKVGLYTLGLGLILLGGAFLLRNTMYSYLWDPPVLAAVLLILLGLEFIITKLIVDRRQNSSIGISGLSVTAIILIVMALFSVQGARFIFGRVMHVPIEKAVSWGIQWDERSQPKYDESLHFSANEMQGTREIIIDIDQGKLITQPSSDGELRIQAVFYDENYRTAPAQTVLPGWFTRSDGQFRLTIRDQGRTDLTLYIPENTEILTLNNELGSIEAEGLKNDVRVRASLGAVKIREITGNVRVDSASGEVIIKDVNGNVDIPLAALGSVEVENVTGNLSVQNNAGDVRLSNIDGDAAVRVDLGSAILRNVGGKVNARVATGNLELIRVAGAVEASVDMGNLEWTPSDMLGFSIEAQARFGAISTDSSTYGKPVREATSETLKSVLGDGSIPIRLKAATGNITLARP